MGRQSESIPEDWLPQVSSIKSTAVNLLNTHYLRTGNYLLIFLKSFKVFNKYPYKLENIGILLVYTNTKEDLAIFTKTVGSDFFLTDRQLVPTYALGFATLQAYSSLQSQSLGTSKNSLSVSYRLLLPNSIIDEFISVLKDWKMVFKQYNFNLSV